MNIEQEFFRSLGASLVYVPIILIVMLFAGGKRVIAVTRWYGLLLIAFILSFIAEVGNQFGMILLFTLVVSLLGRKGFPPIDQHKNSSQEDSAPEQKD